MLRRKSSDTKARISRRPKDKFGYTKFGIISNLYEHATLETIPGPAGGLMKSLHCCSYVTFTTKSANGSEHVDFSALRNSNSLINGHWLGRFR